MADVGCMCAGTCGMCRGKSVRYGRRREYQCENECKMPVAVPNIQAEMENAVKSLRVYAFIGQKQIGYYRGTTGLNPDAGGKISFWMDLELPPYSALVQDVWFYLVANEDAMERPSATLREDMTRDELESFILEKSMLVVMVRFRWRSSSLRK